MAPHGFLMKVKKLVSLTYTVMVMNYIIILAGIPMNGNLNIL